MKAIVMHRHGDPAVLEYQEYPLELLWMGKLFSRKDMECEIFLKPCLSPKILYLLSDLAQKLLPPLLWGNWLMKG